MTHEADPRIGTEPSIGGDDDDKDDDSFIIVQLTMMRTVCLSEKVGDFSPVTTPTIPTTENQ